MATDDFDNSNDTQLTTHNADWVLNRGDFHIRNNGLACDNGGGGDCGAANDSEASASAVWAEATIDARTAGVYMGVGVRHAGSGTDQYYGVYSDTNNRYLFRYDSGNWYQLATDTAVAAVGEVVRCDANGTTITGTRDGGNSISQTDTNIGSGFRGVVGYYDGTGQQNNARIDDWTDDIGAGGAVETALPGTANLVLDGYQPAMIQAIAETALPGNATLLLDAYQPGVPSPLPRTALPGSADLVLDGYQAAMLQVLTETASPGFAQLVMDAYQPAVTAAVDETLLPGVANLVIDGNAVTLGQVVQLVASPGFADLVLDAYAPVMAQVIDITALPGVAEVVFDGYQPIASTSGEALQPGPAELVLNGYQPSLAVQVVVSANPGAAEMILEAYQPGVSTGDEVEVNLFPGFAQLVFQGFSPEVVAAYWRQKADQAGSIWGAQASAAGAWNYRRTFLRGDNYIDDPEFENAMAGSSLSGVDWVRGSGSASVYPGLPGLRFAGVGILGARVSQSVSISPGSMVDIELELSRGPAALQVLVGTQIIYREFTYDVQIAGITPSFTGNSWIWRNVEISATAPQVVQLRFASGGAGVVRFFGIAPHSSGTYVPVAWGEKNSIWN